MVRTGARRHRTCVALSRTTGPRSRTALKPYGMILADNGSAWYISGMSEPRFDDDALHELDDITGRDLEVVDTTGFVNG